MLKYELTKVVPDLFDWEETTNVYFTLKFPEINQEYEIRSVPGFNMFTFHRKGHNSIPKEFEGSFTEQRLLVQAIETFARNYKNIIPKAPKPSAPVIASTAKAS